MNLNEEERRELNEIAQHLKREDGRLATLLSTMKAPRGVALRRFQTVFAVVATALLFLAIAAAAIGNAPALSEDAGVEGTTGTGNPPDITVGHPSDLWIQQPGSPGSHAQQNDTLSEVP